MESIGKIIYSLLDGSVSAPVTPVRAKQDVVLPHVVYYESDSKPWDCKQETTTYTDTFQVSIFANTYKEVQKLSEEINQALDRQSGTVAGILVNEIRYTDKNELFDDTAALFQKDLMYNITYYA